jgi:hypothetical protein
VPFTCSEEIIDALVRVLLDQIHHALPAEISIHEVVENGDEMTTYLGHDWLAILILNISERHLCAFVLAELQVRVVEVRDIAEGVFSQS